MKAQALHSVAAIAALSFAIPALATDKQFADQLISYESGINANPSYLDPLTALGSPERASGEFFGLWDVVSAFSPPYGPDEIVAVGAGGHLTVKFAQPVLNDPNNLYGVDLLIFGNTFFIDEAWPAGIVNGFVGNVGGTIELSADGKSWHQLTQTLADRLYPRIGYLDSGPYDHKPGAIPSDFTRPVDPALSLEDFLGLGSAEIADLYRGSGGGVGVDLAEAGLEAISFVRISMPADAPDDLLIDGFSDVSPRMPGDVNLDSAVDVDDLLLVINSWGQTKPGGPPSDFNLDGVVNVDDLLTVINNWSA